MQQKKKLSRKVISYVLALVMVFSTFTGIVPGTGITVQAEGTDKTIAGLGTSAIGNPTSTESTATAWAGSYVYYGKYDGKNPTKYRVLDTASADFGVEGDSLLLDCDKILYASAFYDNNSNVWSSSLLIRSGLQGDKFLNKQDVFTVLEKSAIASSTKASSVEKDGAGNSRLKYVALNDDTVFLLDAKEASRASYGYASNGTRIKDGNTDGTDGWWLRSTRDGHVTGLVRLTDEVGALGSFGSGNGGITRCVSPAFNIGLSSVIFASEISSEPGSYKLTLKDDALGIAVTEGKKVEISGNTLTIPYTVSGENSANATQVSVLVTGDSILDESGNIIPANMTATNKKAYGKLVTEGSFATSGTGTFELPSDLTGTIGTDYHVYLLAEDVNGEKETDYANLKEITADDIEGLFAALDNVAPTITITKAGGNNEPDKTEIPQIDDKLTANTDPAGATPVIYQWYRDGEPISDATGKTYTLTADDADKTITVKASQPANADGNGSAAVETNVSNPTAAVELKTPAALDENTAKTEGITISYDNETIAPNSGYEVSSTNEGDGETITSLTEILDGEETPTIYVRRKETNDTAAGQWVAVTLPTRPVAPTDLTTNTADNGTSSNGKINGVKDTMEYSPKAGDTWTQATGTTIDNLNPGVYLVRIKATADAPAGKTTEVKVGSKENILTDKQKPEAKADLVYTGDKQALVNAPAEKLPEWATKIQYALGTDATTKPEASAYKDDIPTGSDSGTYYVWYRVYVDDNNASDPTLVTVEISPVDKAGLNKAIKEAEDYYNTIKDNPAYSEQAKALSDAIKTAKALADNKNATAAKVTAGITAITEAKKKAEAEVKDIDDTAAAKKVTDAINALPASNKVATTDKAAIEAAKKAYDALTADQKKKVSADVLKKLTDAENALKAAEAVDKAAKELEAAKKEAQAAMNEQVTVTQKGKKFTVKWKKSTSADGYYVYAQYCGKKVTKPVKTITKNTTTKTTISKIGGKKINQKKQFKVYVAPYKIIDGKKVTLGKSTVAHLVGSKNAKYSNVKKLTLTKSKYTVKVGKTKKIKAKVTLVNKNKKHIPKGHGAKFRYKSSDTGIATVDKNGKIKGIKKGACTIYVYSINGLMKKAKVTVK